jgi:hypothetical protein
MDAADIFILIAAVLFGLAALQSSVADARLRFAVSCTPLGLMCLAIAFLIERN